MNTQSMRSDAKGALERRVAPGCSAAARQGRPGSFAVLKWALLDRLTGRRRSSPPGPAAPSTAPDLTWIQSDDATPRLTWIGHASFLLQTAGANLLIDPVFSDRIGWFYPRHAPPGLTADQLPAIDAVLITHSHYDHLDRESLAALPRSASVICGRGLGRWFVKLGFALIIELDWWETVRAGRVHVTFVPARHWSRRTLFDTNRSLWGGFVVEGGGARVYHAGDTAWFDGFREIAERFPALDAALLPIGGYEPRWFMRHNHLSPEEAGRAFLNCGARMLAPMHWGTFQMTDEPLSEPIERLRAWWSAHHPADGRALREMRIGETIALGGAEPSSGRPPQPVEGGRLV